MIGKKRKKPTKAVDGKYSRRDFVVGGGSALAGGALAAISAPTATVAAEKSPYALSKAYLVYDSRRCTGCLSCMLACSLVHDGATSTAFSRIQVSRAVLAKYPHDIQIYACRQCPEPMCVKNCPTGACHISAADGNVRMIDARKCIGCQTCLKSCPFVPHRTVWNHISKKATKCDLCADTPYFDKKGGPSAAQACVITCPVGALKVVTELPEQRDNVGYDISIEPPAKAKPGIPFPKEGGPEAKPKSQPPTAAPAKV
jgi:protein NrfC